MIKQSTFQVWKQKNMQDLKVFEYAMITTLRDRGIEFAKDDDMDEFEGMIDMRAEDNGEMIGAVIVLSSKMLESDARIFNRIITIAHEFGHYADVKTNFNNNITTYEEIDEITQEERAWDLGAQLLEASGWDKFGYMGWLVYRNHIATLLATYYYNEERYDDFEEARQDALLFANTLLHEKLKRFREEAMSLARA